jgi:radical SAM protein with 4Fe4S-binding SPASM domain
MRRILKALGTFATGRLNLVFDKVHFTYEHLSWKRRWNWFLDELSYVLKASRAWSLPTHLQIEPSNECNLRCPLCHVVTDDKPHGLLELDDFKRIIDEVGDSILFLHFWGWGEPFLNPQIYAMIRYAKNKGLRIISSTNGHFFTDEANVDKLIASGLDVLIVAVDGADAETYEKYRQRGDFECVMSGLRLLLRRRREHGSALPRINLRMLVTRDNEHQVPELKRIARDLGVDVFSLKTLCSFDNAAEWETIVPCNPEYRRFFYTPEGEPIRINNPCKKPWNHPTLYRDGVVVPCDYYTGTEFNLGNAYEGGFRRVWSGAAFRRLRRRFAKKDRAGLRCDTCSLNYADVDRCVAQAFTQQDLAAEMDSGDALVVESRSVSRS